MTESFPARAYIICCDARTGSSLLAATLRQTAQAGKPFEYFGEAEIDKPWMREELHIPEGAPFTSFREWRNYILKAGAEPNGVFAATVHWFQLGHALDAFRSQPSQRPLEILRGFFPELRLIWLRRDNIVAQAISHYVAISTGVWRRRQGQPALGDTAAPYDFDLIDRQVKSAVVATQGWRETLGDAPEITLPLSYEELSADLDRAVHKVFAHLGLSLGDRAVPPPALQKQASTASLELERRYREERRTRGLGPVGDEANLSLL